mmetsp:Transcript_22131/g.58629  ORF Transcript_22131/g.58629 Transcript_22131/m.58629 type:complete len:218 (-) Transcript_22131:481-1134(-)
MPVVKTHADVWNQVRALLATQKFHCGLQNVEPVAVLLLPKKLRVIIVRETECANVHEGALARAERFLAALPSNSFGGEIPSASCAITLGLAIAARLVRLCGETSRDSQGKGALRHLRPHHGLDAGITPLTISDLEIRLHCLVLATAQVPRLSVGSGHRKLFDCAHNSSLELPSRKVAQASNVSRENLCSELLSWIQRFEPFWRRRAFGRLRRHNASS